MNVPPLTGKLFRSPRTESAISVEFSRMSAPLHKFFIGVTFEGWQAFGEMARRYMLPEPPIGWGFLPAYGLCMHAARMESASLRKGAGHRRRAFNGKQFSAAIAKCRNGGDQPARIRMARVFKKLVYPGLFHHLSGIDDGHPVGMTGEYAKIMRDEDQSQAELVLKIAQDGHDLRLNRHIESGGRLVCDQKIGIVGDGHRNHDTLAHAAGKLMRILFDPLVGLRDRNQFQQFHRARQRLFAAQALLVELQRFDDLIADFHHRVQR
ncbi:hypothetical protein DK59_3081 [Brucella abortus bv. 4 str. 292]|nr:hypothetical protein DK59_3081 [Brucella abortus bv. 4 str. 292]